MAGEDQAARIGPWRIASRRTVFENPWIRVVDHCVVHPNDEPGEYGVVQFKNLAIGVLPIDREGCVPLVGQHRFPHDRYSWELPEGGGPLGVDALVSAQRELREETGFSAGSWRELTRFDISNSVTDEKAVCYLAWDLVYEGASAPDPSEDLSVKRVPFETLWKMTLNGDISDSLTIVMVLTARAKALQGDAPEPISHLLAGSSRRP